MYGVIVEIDYQTAVDFLLPKHYSGRIPTISVAYGWYDTDIYTDDHLKAVITFGKPASPALCKGICGIENASSVYELNRLCRTDDWKQPLSQLVSTALKKLKPKNWIIVSYADTAMNHHGYVYQACNFLYTGKTLERTDKYTPEGKHSRHYKQSQQCGLRKFRSSKHRYVYFCTSNKKLKQEWMNELKYKPQQYPKGDNNEDYTLGTYLKDKIIDTRNSKINL